MGIRRWWERREEKGSSSLETGDNKVTTKCLQKTTLLSFFQMACRWNKSFFSLLLEIGPRRTVLQPPFKSSGNAHPNSFLEAFGSHELTSASPSQVFRQNIRFLAFFFFLDAWSSFLHSTWKDVLEQHALECEGNSVDSCQPFARVMNDLRKDACQVHSSTWRLGKISGAI